jgi:hypothetical protein
VSSTGAEDGAQQRVNPRVLPGADPENHAIDTFYAYIAAIAQKYILRPQTLVEAKACRG